MTRVAPQPTSDESTLDGSLLLLAAASGSLVESTTLQRLVVLLLLIGSHFDSEREHEQTS